MKFATAVLCLLLPCAALAQQPPVPTGPVSRAEKGVAAPSYCVPSDARYPYCGGVAILDVTGKVPDEELRVFDATHQGVVPPSGGGTTKFLGADGTWAIPPGSVAATLTTGHIFVGNGSNVPADVAMSGVCSISTSGVVACPLGGDITGTLGAVTVAKINGQTPAAIATSGSATDLISGTVALARLPQTSVPTPTEQMLLGNATFGLPKWLSMDLGDNYAAGNAAQPGNHSLLLGPGAGSSLSGTVRTFTHAFGWFALTALTDAGVENEAFGQCALCHLVDGGFNTAFGNGSGYTIVHGVANSLFGLDNMRGQLTTLDGSWVSGADGNYNVAHGYGALGGSDGSLPFSTNVVTAATWSGGSATLTTTTTHGITGAISLRPVPIHLSGFTPTTWNGYWPAGDGTTGNTIVLAMPIDPGAVSVLGQLDAGGGPVDFEFETALGKAADPCAACSGLSQINVAVGVNTLGGVIALGQVRQDDTVVGAFAGGHLVASNDTLIGAFAGYMITSGTPNTCGGFESCYQVGTGSGNVAWGSGTLAYLNSTAIIQFNVAIGTSTFSGRNTTTGTVQRNVGIGYDVAHAADAASSNVFAGFEVAFNLSTGSFNVCAGDSSCFGFTTDSFNVSLGAQSLLFLNKTGTVSSVVAVGFRAMSGSAISDAINDDVAVGTNAGLVLDASRVTLVGFDSGLAMSTGTDNTCMGSSSCASATTGVAITATGSAAGLNVTTGAFLTLIGRGAGGTTLTTGSRVIIIGDGDVTDTPNADTQNYLNIGNSLYADMLKMHESVGTGALPVFGAGCGGATGNPPAGTANDDIGTIVEGGTASTTCTILWHASYANTSRVCVVWSPNITGGVLGDDSQVDRLVITHASFTGGIIKYHCRGIGPQVWNTNAPANDNVVYWRDVG